VKEKKLHMIGNAHLDPVWLWQWQEGLQEVKATFRSALDRLDEYEDFLFTASSRLPSTSGSRRATPGCSKRYEPV
jgi:alpha-mannosidase